MKKFDTSLYFITDSTGFTEEEFLQRTEAALQGGVTFLQIREKEKTTREYLSLAQKLGASVVLEINLDHPVAEKLKALYTSDKDTLAKYAKILYSEACLVSGISLENPTELCELVSELMLK